MAAGSAFGAGMIDYYKMLNARDGEGPTPLLHLRGVSRRYETSGGLVTALGGVDRAVLAAAEALVMGEKLGVDRKVLYDVIATSTGRSYSLERSCPIPGPVPTAPSSTTRASAPQRSAMSEASAPP